MSTLPPLHPESVRKVLRTIKKGECTLLPEEIESCRAALELVRKGQLAVGLSSNAVDAFNKARHVAGQGIELIEAITKLGKLK